MNDKNKPVNLADMADYLKVKTEREAAASDRAFRRRLQEASASAAMAQAALLVAAKKTPEPDPRANAVPAFSDLWVALTFSERHADNLRYCHKWGKWFKWDDIRWRADETKEIFDLARKVCTELAKECNDASDSKQLASSRTVAAVKWSAECDRRHATTTDQWDANPWLFNTPGGTVDLRTGALRPNAQDDYITKVAAVAPEGECPLWHRFLAEITGGDVELQLFLQRVVGYALTGTTVEHALFFLYGTGANGKSVFLATIGGIIGDYHRTAPIETFMDSVHTGHPTDLAGLRGARLVTSIETEEGRRWAEKKIKALTGGEKIAARFMRQDFFEYMPEFKLVIAGNHKPKLRSVDEAIKRRFNLIPFTVTIPRERRDLDLAEKLKAEWPGILKWMVQGCLDWQRGGLAPPKAVIAATAEYLAGEDNVLAWIEECCEQDAHAWEPRTRLYFSWTTWAERTGETACSAKDLYSKLEGGDGVYLSTVNGVRGFKGLRIRPDYGSE